MKQLETERIQKARKAQQLRMKKEEIQKLQEMERIQELQRESDERKAMFGEDTRLEQNMEKVRKQIQQPLMPIRRPASAKVQPKRIEEDPEVIKKRQLEEESALEAARQRVAARKMQEKLERDRVEQEQERIRQEKERVSSMNCFLQFVSIWILTFSQYYVTIRFYKWLKKDCENNNYDMNRTNKLQKST